MIKFFRKIRQQLLSQNRFTKYLLYAIGEILLVVIGILIALQVNNLNEERIKANATNQFLNQLIVETDINISNLESVISKTESKMKCIEAILGFFKIDSLEIDLKVLDSLIYISLDPDELDINLETLKEGLNTGVIANVKSNSLKREIYGVQSNSDKIRYYENIIMEDNINNYVPFLYDNYNFRNMDATYFKYRDRIGKSSFATTKNRDIFKFLKFENLVDNQMVNYGTKLLRYTDFKNKLESLKSLINQEMAND